MPSSLRFFNNIINHIMDNELTTSLILKKRKSKRNQYLENYIEPPRRQSMRIYTEPEQTADYSSNQNFTSQDLQWQKSDYQQEDTPIVIPSKQPQTKIKLTPEWYGEEQADEKTLNDKVFNLKPAVQNKLYAFNFLMNVLMRIAFINLLIFLGIQNKWLYFELFISLQFVALVMYIIVMIKMLFTRSDKESVYFQKIFNEKEWADIASERLMRSHFNLKKILSKARIFFNPFSKFQKDTKISFLRQQLFKRMEIVMVYIPFSVMFFIRQSDFVSADKPNFKIYITAAICLQALRTTATYLAIFIFS